MGDDGVVGVPLPIGIRIRGVIGNPDRHQPGAVAGGHGYPGIQRAVREQPPFEPGAAGAARAKSGRDGWQVDTRAIRHGGSERAVPERRAHGAVQRPVPVRERAQLGRRQLECCFRRVQRLHRSPVVYAHRGLDGRQRSQRPGQGHEQQRRHHRDDEGDSALSRITVSGRDHRVTSQPGSAARHRGSRRHPGSPRYVPASRAVRSPAAATRHPSPAASDRSARAGFETDRRRTAFPRHTTSRRRRAPDRGRRSRLPAAP